jgi:peptidoglycan/xylan/chitin deacetylase (PgdA/CDA1 family)
MVSGAASAGPKIEISHHVPCNLFTPDQPVAFEAQLRGFAPGPATVTATVTDYFNQPVWTQTKSLTIDAKMRPGVSLPIGVLPPGYYALSVKAAAGSDVVQTASFGVTPFVHRTAQQARDGGYRFGLKIFQVGDIWWRRPLQWRLDEALDASTHLGLQWTRQLFNQKNPATQPGIVSVQDVIDKHAMNVVLKIELFPQDCYDAKRYGPLAEWEKKHGKNQWQRRTVPAKAAYQKWLREQLQPLPQDQNIFEIANEPWGKISPQEFAEYCQMIIPVVKEVNPGAIIGSNTGMGPIAWEKAFIKAGGMEGMNMVTIHPYSFTPPPEQRVRQWIRNYHEFLKEQLGHDLPLYVTEYGWSTAPDSDRHGVVNETQQAQRVVRESLLLYAEDCKVLIPHWIADREQDPKNWDQWFGFFRLTAEPKPVVPAFATCARMIDASKYVGDLWYGHGVGAMLFERGGKYTLALWTLDDKPGTARKLTLDVHVPQVTVVNTLGQEHSASTTDGKLELDLSADVIYVVGVSPDLAKAATRPDQPLNADRWGEHEGQFPIAHINKPPVIDGQLDDWQQIPAIALPQVSGPASASNEQHRVWLGWDDANVYVAVRSTDRQIVTADADHMARGDLFKLGLGVRPGRALNIRGWQLDDYELELSPASADARPALRMSNSRWDEALVNPPPSSPSGVRWASSAADGGWTAELSIPRKLLRGLPPDVAGQKILGYLMIQDVGRDGGKTVRYASGSDDTPVHWSWMAFQK